MEVEESLNEQMCRTAEEKMYLNYLDNSLLEQGVITPMQHRKMKLQITTRKTQTPTRQGSESDYGKGGLIFAKILGSCI